MSRSVTIEGRKLPSGVEHLATVVLCGIRVPIVRATSDLVPNSLDPGDDGAWDYGLTSIFIRAGQSKTQERDSIVHEVIHALFYLSGLREHVKVLIGGEDRLRDAEEVFVRLLTPHAVALVEENEVPWR